MAAIQDPPQHPSRTTARSAEPFLASSLIDSSSFNAVFDKLNISHVTETPSAKPDVLQTGIKNLDDALGATVQSGRVIAFSSETSSQRDDLAKTLLVDCLVRHSQSLVAVIDTTGNFDVVGLYTQILNRLEKEPGKVAEMGGVTGGQSEKLTSEGVAAKTLDRVKIMRVFDFVGVREAVGELSDGLEGRAMKAESVEKATTPVNMVRKENQAPLKKRTEVADSEDEGEDIEASDDEMLFDTGEPAPAPEPAVSPAVQPEQHDASDHHSQPSVKLILIDNLAHVLTPLLKKNALSANTLAATFLTTLNDLTRTHSLHTILLNPCTAPRASSPTRQPPSHSTQQQHNPPAPQQSYVPQPPPPPSVFSSTAAVPALLGLLSRYADAHVLMTMVPRRKMDAKVYYAETGGRERGKRRGVEMVGVLEVVADRWGERVGAWGKFAEGRAGRGIGDV